ncbi:thioredoxin-like protein [Neoconidiobolus thromboides FSU 785]|nr:thioredoxin-like protein [Neoconidiobolus thromboides FSU 785]
MSRSIKFWFEYSSPYSAISVYEILALAKRGDFSKNSLIIEPRPLLLGALLKKLELPVIPFASNEPKFNYMWHDSQRQIAKIKSKYNLKDSFNINKPKDFPINGLLAARATISLQNEIKDTNSQNLLNFILKMYDYSFNKDIDINDKDLIKEEISSYFPDLNPDLIVDNATKSEIKESLKANTEEAYNLNMFGAPTFTVSGEIFWGSDRLHDAIEKALE